MQSSDLMNVLVVAPHPDLKGGVSNYYRVINSHLPRRFKFFYLEKEQFSSVREKFVYLFGKRNLDFARALVRGKFDLVFLNPSLDYKSLIRDGVFIIISRLLRKQVIVFFRGWIP